METASPDTGHPRSATMLDAAWRVAFRTCFGLARLWWSIRRPRHEGTQAVIWIGDRLLLLRSSYRREWSFPGGGVQGGETPEQALRRELAEEIGLRPDMLSPAGSASGIWDGRRDRVTYFELRLDHAPDLRWDNREIVGAQLFRVAELTGVPTTGPVKAFLAGTVDTGQSSGLVRRAQRP